MAEQTFRLVKRDGKSGQLAGRNSVGEMARLNRSMTTRGYASRKARNPAPPLADRTRGGEIYAVVTPWSRRLADILRSVPFGKVYLSFNPKQYSVPS